MNRFSCDKEKKVLECLLKAGWPETAGESLVEHTVSCLVCSDLILAVRHLQEQGRRAMTEATVPDAGLVWWKAQLRARRDAADRATQPINVVEGLALACASIYSAVVVLWKWPSIRAGVSRLGDFGSGVTIAWTQQFSPLLLSAYGACVVLTALGLYFAGAEK